MAGKPYYDQPATVRVVVRLTPVQRKDLERVAAENNTSLAGVIREAVNDYVADYRETKVFRLPR